MKDNSLWVVGIGSSAGGLEALTLFVSALPTETEACFVVAQHLAPHAKSMMVELISRQAPIPVDVVSADKALQPNRIYIVPPNHDVEFAEGKLILIKAGDETRPKPSVDRFFTSLAREFGKRAIGVILSGTGTDGADGTRAVKLAGGITIAQSEASAKYFGMPSASIDTGQVDLVLTPGEIADKIVKIVDKDALPFEVDSEQTTSSFGQMLALIRKELGNDFSQYKIPTIKRRLGKRMLAVGAEDLEAYYQRIKVDANELRSLAQDFLVSVTAFFRDGDAFEVLTESLKPLVSARNEGEEVRVWSAGCASGEEAYTIAMILHKLASDAGKKLTLKIFATDLDTDAISKGRIGVYGESDLTGLPSGYMNLYFERRGDAYEIKKSVRDLVVFARQDIIQSPPFVKLDLICCRNVIIYFEPKLQSRVFDIFNYALKPGGLLLLGKSEALSGPVENFDVIDKKAKLFVKKASTPRTLPTVVRMPSTPIDMSQARRKITTGPSPTQLAQAQILERYGVAGAIVEVDGTIQTIVGNVAPFLKIPDGLESFRLQGLLPKAAGVEFQLLLRKAAKSKSLHVSRAFACINETSKGVHFQIQISPFETREEASTLSPALMLVTFDKIGESAKSLAMPSTQDGDLALRAAELEQELAATREHLQTVIEELGVANEELQSTNEELSSTNEELQSSNEELETTNEEFQSTNEELTTLNEEMNVKTVELRLVNTDLENIQISIGVPLLVVDKDLRLQRFNPSANELFDISLTDVGRPLPRLSCRCEIESFALKVTEVIDSGQPSSSTVEGYKSVYQMRITPRRDENQKVVGAVILFYNNTNLILAEQKLRKSESRIRGIINGTSSLISLKDMSGKYLTVNQSFLDYFGFKEELVVGRSDREIFPDRFANQLRNGDLEAIVKRSRVDKQEEFDHKGRQSVFLVSHFPLNDESSFSPYGVVTMAVDISKQVSAQEALRKSEALYRGVVEDQSVFVLRFDPSGAITFVNAAFTYYFGGSSADYIGKPFSHIVDTQDRAMVAGELSRLSSQKQLLQLEHRFTRFGTASRWIRWINKAVLNEKGRLQEVQAVGFDVTEYRQQTDQMVQREMLFSNIFTYTTDFLTVFRVTPSKELLLESFNRSVDDGGGYTYAQFLGRNVRDLVTSQHRNEILEKYRACVERQEPQTFDEELFLQGGIKYLTTTVIPVVNNAGVVERVVTLSRDISKFKTAEAELNAAKAAAEIANETKSDFLASMSHELRSPLNVVIGMSELLQDAELNESAREQVKSISRSGKVLLTLIEDILDISKIEAGKTKLEFTNFSLRELVQDVTETFQPQVKSKGIELNVKYPLGQVDHFIGDAGRVRQILVNLVGNAVKFTEQGKVEVTISSVGHKTTGRRLVRFDVKDSGIGIPEEHHSRIFKKFSQVDSGLGRRYGGTGLGLVICQRLTTLMNGQIGFTSEWSKGSTFWFELPLSIAKKTRVEKATPPSAMPTGPLCAKILAVDDSPDGRMLLGMLMKRLGHECEMVDSGEAAIAAVQKNKYDLVLMDVQMPGMDGYEATARIRKLKHPNHALPILALTANAMVGDSEKCFDAGMNDYITKPINLDLLRSAIVKWSTRPVVHARESASK